MSGERLSVIIRAGAPGWELDRTLFALACQELPCEVLLWHRDPGDAAALLALGQKHAAIGGFAVRTVFERDREPGGEGAAAHDPALAMAQEPLVAFVAPGDFVYPRHFARLAEALRESDAAWALAPGVRVRTVAEHATGRAPLWTPGLPPLAVALLGPPPPSVCLLVDRARLHGDPGGFALELGMAAGEARPLGDRLLALRLAAALPPAPALLPPGFVHQRSDEQDRHEQAALAPLLAALLSAPPSLPLSALRSALAPLLAPPAPAPAEVLPVPLRHRLADLAAEVAKGALGGRLGPLRRSLRALAGRVAGGGES